MIDLHSHIIHGVDDGPSSIEQSIKMVAEAEKLGIQLIVATPHYHENIFDAEKVEENFQELLYKTSDFDVAIKIGFEVFLNPFQPVLTKVKKRFTLARTEYMLFEFPLNASPIHCLDIIKKLKAEKIVPIIAHPERNRNFLNNFSTLVSLIKAGCLIQVDAASIAGIYGKKVKEFSKKLIKLNFADLVASNAHYASDYSEWYMEAYKNVIQWAGQDSAYKLFAQNAKNMLEGIEENIYKVIG